MLQEPSYKGTSFTGLSSLTYFYNAVYYAKKSGAGGSQELREVFLFIQRCWWYDLFSPFPVSRSIVLNTCSIQCFAEKYDVVVVGGGPGGYVAAIKAAQLGLKVKAFHLTSENGACI